MVLFTLTPPGQEAVAWLLRISGIRVELTETSIPMSPPTKLIDELEVTPEEAESCGWIRAPPTRRTTCPDSVQLVDWGGGQQVAMLWNQSSQLPEVMETGVGLLLLQFEARVDQELLVKEASDATRINPVSVNGDTGYFLSGAPHTVFFLGPDGVIADDQIRLAGNVLVWMADGITYRIESALRSGGSPAGGGISRLSGLGKLASLRGCSSMVELQPSKLVVRVRSPSPAR